MARGRKKALPLEGQLEKVISDISFTEEALKELKLKKKTIEEKMKIQKLDQLNAVISEKGLTIDQVTDLIANNDCGKENIHSE